MFRIILTAALICTPLTVLGQNTANTFQTGTSNGAGTFQNGDNDAITLQNGNSNGAAISQNGDWNAAVIAQVGNGFSQGVTQSSRYQGFGSFQFSATGYTGDFTSNTTTWYNGNGITSTTLSFGVNNN